MSTAIVWFRADLRLHDHPALSAASREYDSVAPVFVVDPTLLDGRLRSPRRVAFMLDCLRSLDDALREKASALLAFEGAPERVLPRIARKLGAEVVLWTSDVSPYARRRDREVTEALREAGVEARPHGGNYVVDVSKPRTGGGDPFRVFTPFFRSWQELPRREMLAAPARIPPLPRGHTMLGGRTLPSLAREHAGDAADAPIAEPGEAAARRAMRRWLVDGLRDYERLHDSVGAAGTSRLSPYLRWGCLSPLELEAGAEKVGGSGAEAWIRQLCWRDFYAHVLLHWPENVRREFQPAMRRLEWDEDRERLRSWQQGMTGYPIVDAAMRELAATGWMHNRARLIVGSFLTKDLQLDWRSGERWFAEQLLDGEPAQNNGNWQWIASVGVDPAPTARRLYNPTTQGRRFDPNGDYIRRWVPELEDVPDELIHEPSQMDESAQKQSRCRLDRDYPSPIVDHRTERRRALERYERARRSSHEQGI
ncbi:MAG: cryptochrome/photolyase family protein [Solirubrobacteraceae bacterium]